MRRPWSRSSTAKCGVAWRFDVDYSARVLGWLGNLVRRVITRARTFSAGSELLHVDPPGEQRSIGSELLRRYSAGERIFDGETFLIENHTRLQFEDVTFRRCRLSRSNIFESSFI